MSAWCACPCIDASDCAARRYGRDLRLLLDGDDYHDDPDFDSCGCSCHDDDEDREPLTDITGCDV